MMHILRRHLTLAGTALLLAAAPAAAQNAHGHQQVISANPFGLLIELFNAEYERVVSESATAGLGGSTFVTDDENYVNADAFFRFYPQGSPLEGWAFGAKIGVTRRENAGTRFGYGFDVNRSWLMGRNNNFYVGVGFGLKRLLGESGSDNMDIWDVKYVPTFRIINVGFAF